MDQMNAEEHGSGILYQPPMNGDEHRSGTTDLAPLRHGEHREREESQLLFLSTESAENAENKPRIDANEFENWRGKGNQAIS